MKDEKYIEVSDYITQFNEKTLERIEVNKEETIEQLLKNGFNKAAKIVSKIKCDSKNPQLLDQHSVDRLLIKAHLELQRLEEEFLHGHRVLQSLKPLLKILEERNTPYPWKIVDIGCGLGYVVRWLTSQGGLGNGIEIVGTDFNSSLIHVARRLAEQEGLRCQFEVMNAFDLKSPATIFISSGVMHHFRGDNLKQFFVQQADSFGFIHFDIKPQPLAPIGAWLFHKARMRTKLAQHDGVASALRAYPAKDLIETATKELENFEIEMNEDLCTFISNQVFQAIVGYLRD